MKAPIGRKPVSSNNFLAKYLVRADAIECLAVFAWRYLFDDLVMSRTRGGEGVGRFLGGGRFADEDQGVASAHQVGVRELERLGDAGGFGGGARLQDLDVLGLAVGPGP